MMAVRKDRRLLERTRWVSLPPIASPARTARHQVWCLCQRTPFPPACPAIVSTTAEALAQEEPANPQLAIANPKFRCPAPIRCFPPFRRRNYTIAKSEILSTFNKVCDYQIQNRPFLPGDLRKPIVGRVHSARRARARRGKVSAAFWVPHDLAVMTRCFADGQH